ncbi:MAG: cadmium-translocating P-type ATPase [Eubacteriales bacterium]|nr:cadmium-translocating P-type ATPase [Eubacteriales bacterium]
MSGCGCGHCHSDNNEHKHGNCSCEHGNNGINILAIKLVVGVLTVVAGLFARERLRTVLFAVSYLVLGYDVLIRAVKNLLKRKPLDENFLMTVAAVGAFVLGEQLEASAVMLFYQIGELLTENAVDKTRSSISALADVRPDTARILTEDGERIIDCHSIEVGMNVLVGAGERIPIDGVIKKGAAMIDTSSLTGEHLPRYAEVGDRVLAGTISTDGSLEIETEKEFGETMFSRILYLAEEANEKKSGAERFITSFAKVYTPIVVILALIVAVLPPLFGIGSFSVWVYRALSFLVVSCPCALVVSVPLTFFAGIGAASGKGILIKNGLAMEKLSKTKTVALDKTGTITVGIPKLTEIRVNGSKAELIELAAYAESDSNHPIAQAIKEAYGKNIDRSRIADITEVPARGVEAVIDGRSVVVGSEKLFAERGIEIKEYRNGSAIYVAADEKCLGYIGFGDTVKPTSTSAVKELKEMGISVVMLSGDNRKSAYAVAEEVGITDIYAELMPHEKAEYIDQMKKNGDILFAGDGINDSPALASATVGAAMGGIGSDAAIEAADVVIMGDELMHIPMAIKLSERVVAVAKQNIVLSVGIKLAVMLITAFGAGGMWPAIFADVGLCVITVANALRAYYIRVK